MKLLIPAEILKAATVYTSKDETRYNINCLLFEDGNVIATNGHSLLVWRHIAIQTHTEDGEKIPNFLMSFDKDAIKFVKAANKAVLAFHYDTETHILSTGYGQSYTLQSPSPVTDFPEWRKTLPDVQALVPVALPISTEITETFNEYAKARKGKGVHGFTVLTTGEANPFYLMPYDFDDCFIVAMPVRSKQTLENHLETINKVSGVKETPTAVITDYKETILSIKEAI